MQRRVSVAQHLCWPLLASTAQRRSISSCSGSTSDGDSSSDVITDVTYTTVAVGQPLHLPADERDTPLAVRGAAVYAGTLSSL
jgi:hypothetical protein